MELRAEFEEREDDFEILAFHDDRVEDWRALEPKLKELERGTWDGRELPFPILLDASGTTLATYGIDSFPTTVAIDPDGNVLKGSGEVLLEDYLLETSEIAQELLAALRADFSRNLPRAVRRKDVRAAWALTQYAPEADEEETKKIFRALEKVGSRYAVAFFLGPEGLESDSRERRLMAISGLQEVESLAGFFPLQEVAQDDGDPAVRKAAARAVEALAELWDD